MNYSKMLLFVSILLFTACSKSKEINVLNTVERNDLTYEVNSQTPFTGIVYKNFEDIEDEKGEKIRNSIFTYKDGIPTGPFITWYKNGQIFQEGSFLNNKLNDKLVTYYENGQLWSETIYKKGKHMEILRDYMPSGIAVEGNTLKNGNGEVKIFDKDGTFLHTAIYENGELVGRDGEAVEEVEVGEW